MAHPRSRRHWRKGRSSIGSVASVVENSAVGMMTRILMEQRESRSSTPSRCKTFAVFQNDSSTLKFHPGFRSVV